MHASRRRKKRPNYGIRTVEVLRGTNGFGFTISGQQPCILSCIVSNSPADHAGLRAGDFLISVNGVSVSKIAHDAVVNLIGNCVAPIRMTIAENYYSDSSEEEMDSRNVTSRKPKYSHKTRANRSRNKINDVKDNRDARIVDDEGGPVEYKALVGYLGTIEMPKQLLPNSRLQTVCTCIKKLRQETRTPTAVLMTIFPTCLTLKNSSNHILAIYPTNRVVYIGSTADKESRYFGLVTSAGAANEKTNDSDSVVSNSCHVFMIDPKIVEHAVHSKKAESFKIACTPDVFGGNCLEFPRSALYIVQLVQNMYKLQGNDAANEQIVANSPQPSASSNSDSGIGFRDDGTVSDRILVVEFPASRSNNPAELNNIRCKNAPNNFNNVNNIRATSVNIKNVLENNLAKQNNEEDQSYNKLTCRVKIPRDLSPVSSDDNTRNTAVTSAICAPKSQQSSIDNISMHSTKSAADVVFKTPGFFKRPGKIVNSCDNLDRFSHGSVSMMSESSLSLKQRDHNVVHSCDELNNLDLVEKYGYGSLQELCRWNGGGKTMRHIAQSEPDVRRSSRTEVYSEGEENGHGKEGSEQGPAAWAVSFEKLLEDPLGLHTFAEFLKKEFSAENIYFWTACERYRHVPSGAERQAEATRIYQQHLCVGAPEGVNVDSHGRLTTEQNLATASPTLFDQAQKQIFNLMKFDSYPRFLKSPLYKQCLNGAVDTKLQQVDVGLSLHPAPPATPTKLKKSLSNAEDTRRKSILPWHRKNRSKSKDRGESEFEQLNVAVSTESVGGASDVHSSKSSLTSLDLAISSAQDSKGGHDETVAIAGCRTALCRVILSNGSTTVVQIKPSETIRELVSRLLEKRGLYYSAFEVNTDKHPKALDITGPSSVLAGCEVTVEQRVVFKMDLPNKKVISVKSKNTKILIDVLRPILLKYNYDLNRAGVFLNSDPVDIYQQVTSVDEKRLRITYGEESPPCIKVNNVKVTKLDEITNQVFKGILQEKSESNLNKNKSDRGSVKSEDWGSEHSSGILGKFPRRDSALQERKKKFAKARSEDGVEQMKKPLIAKLKSGVKLQMATSESDELVEGLTRAQRARLEDQRGTEINFELPDFLKDNDRPNPVSNFAKHSYENRVIPNNVNNNSSFTNNNQNKVNNLRIYSPTKDVNCQQNTERSSEPPPLPPKPKIIPIKPPNWGQELYKNRELTPSDKSKALYLEQPSSSFV